MKKILVLILIFLGTFLLTGCVDRKITPKGISVVFYTGGNGHVDTLFIPKDKLPAKIQKPTIQGEVSLVFQGWFKDMEHKNPFNFDTELVDKSITIYSKWEDKIINITYHLEGANFYDPLTVPNSFKYSEGIILPHVVKEGREFIGWFNKPQSELGASSPFQNIEPKTFDSDVDLYPIFKLRRYNIIFLQHGDSEILDSSIEYEEIMNFKKPKDKDGKRFVGWFSKQGKNGDWGVEYKNGDKMLGIPVLNGDGTISYFSDTINIKFYARFE